MPACPNLSRSPRCPQYHSRVRHVHTIRRSPGQVPTRSPFASRFQLGESEPVTVSWGAIAILVSAIRAAEGRGIAMFDHVLAQTMHKDGDGVSFLEA